MSVKSFFGAVGHDIVKIAHAVKAGIADLAEDAPQMLQDVAKSKTVVEGLTAAVAPGAVLIEEAAYNVLGLVVQAIEDAGTAVASNGLVVALDQTVVSDVKSIIPSLKQFIAKNPSSGASAPAPVADPKAPAPLA